jgi:hypothetical protein
VGKRNGGLPQNLWVDDLSCLTAKRGALELTNTAVEGASCPEPAASCRGGLSHECQSPSRMQAGIAIGEQGRRSGTALAPVLAPGSAFGVLLSRALSYAQADHDCRCASARRQSPDDDSPRHPCCWSSGFQQSDRIHPRGRGTRCTQSHPGTALGQDGVADLHRTRERPRMRIQTVL